LPTPIPAPPGDNAHARLRIKYSNGVHSHRMNVHLAGAILSPSGTFNDYNYVGGAPAGSTETSVIGTFTGLVYAIKGLYTAGWLFTIDALYQVNSGVSTEMFPAPAPAAIQGAITGAETTIPEGMIVFNFRTVGGHRARIECIESQEYINYIPGGQVQASIGGNALLAAVVAYMGGTDTAVVGHDGTHAQPLAHVTTPYNRRLRRHYSHA
jgi:hypothetical protein